MLNRINRRVNAINPEALLISVDTRQYILHGNRTLSDLTEAQAVSTC